jgi:hypothetical protein
MKFNDYDYAVEHLLKISSIYNLKDDETGKFFNTKQDVCKIFNITMSTFDRLMYNFPKKFESHYGNRKSNGKVQFRDLTLDEINDIVNDYKKRELHNEEIIRKHNLAYQTFYRILKLYVKKEEQKLQFLQYDERGLRICNVCGHAFKNEDLIRDKSQKTGYRSECKACFRKRARLRREKQYDNGSNK